MEIEEDKHKEKLDYAQKQIDNEVGNLTASNKTKTTKKRDKIEIMRSLLHKLLDDSTDVTD